MDFLKAAEAVGDKVALQKTSPKHIGPEKPEGDTSFGSVLSGALQETNHLQQNANDLTQIYLTDPDKVDAHDVTIAMGKANMSLQITKAVVDGALKAYNDIINIR